MKYFSFFVLLHLVLLLSSPFYHIKLETTASESSDFEALHHRILDSPNRHNNHNENRNRGEIKHSFDVRRVFPAATVHKDPRLLDELQLYINQHNQDVVKADPDFCNRTFVVATYACPQAVGNHMHEFLNGFIGGFVTNRTLLWTFCERRPCKVDNLGDCDAVMTRHPWILSHWDFMKLWEERKCTWNKDPYELITIHFKAYAEEIAMCCGLDQLNRIIPVINFGNHELHHFYSLSLPNARLLYPFARYRAKLLFRFGEDYGYGMMLRATFQIKSFIIEKNHQLIENHIKKFYPSTVSPPFFISMHLRHATNSDTKNHQDNMGYQCIHDLLPKYYHLLQMLNDSKTVYQRPCVILFASDRPESVDYWSSWKIINQKVNCSILTTDHSKSHIQWTEHGPYTGEIAISDLDLLSRGEIFIGSSYLMAKLSNLVSSFSLLIAALRATNGLEYSTSFPSMWLPECKNIYGAARNPKPMYIDHNLDCKKVVEWPVTLHDACPYSNHTFAPLK